MGVANGASSTSGLDSGMERVIAALLGDTVDAQLKGIFVGFLPLGGF